MTELRTSLREFRENSDRVHNDLKNRVDKHGEEIDAHEKRIIRLEDWRETKGE